MAENLNRPKEPSPLEPAAQHAERPEERPKAKKYPRYDEQPSGTFRIPRT
jgi:hypothetical protein